jgi:acyl-coenzyme A thioesterase 13
MQGLARRSLLRGARALSASAPAAPVPFIERAKVMGAQALLGNFIVNTGRFDRVLEHLKITRIGEGYCEAEIVVTEGTQNAFSTMHGGCVATLVDVVGTMALLSLDPTRPGVSIELNVSFVSAAKAGETVTVHGRTLKTGKMLGFTEVDLKRADGSLVATGRHTKAFGGSSVPKR